jgi:hypothetical protein
VLADDRCASTSGVIRIATTRVNAIPARISYLRYFIVFLLAEKPCSPHQRLRLVIGAAEILPCTGLGVAPGYGRVVEKDGRSDATMTAE